MAITIQTEPDALNTANNPLVFTFSSTNTGQTNFSFLVELTINGSIHSFHQVFVEQSIYGKFNCSELVKNTLQSHVVVDGSLSTDYSDAICSYSIRVREKYGDPVAEQGSWTSSSTVRAFNGSLKHQDWINFDATDYSITDTSGCNFLTNFPRAEKYHCGLTESIFLGYLIGDATQTYLDVELFDISDNSLASDSTVSVSTGSYQTVLDASPQSIIDNTTIVSGDFDDCYYYTIVVKTATPSENSETFKIYLDTACTQFTARRLHWLNKYGVWDSYTFNKYSEESGQVQANSYITEKGTWNSSNQWVYNQYTGEHLNFAKVSQNRMLLNSDWIKEDKHNWLMESLIESPRVYLEISQGVFEPVIVQAQQWTKKRKIRHKLLQESLIVERTYQYVSQLA